MPPERRARLDALGFVWDPLAAAWEEGFRSLARYRQDQGNGLVPQSYRDPASGFRLGGWVRNQREAEETMLPERRQRLDALGFVWGPFADQWEEGFGYLSRYRQEKGNCLVPVTYCDPASGYRLGSWVTNQRTAKDTLLPERRARLDALGFVWDVLTAQWDEGFRFLEIFRQRKGHCRVPYSYRDSGYWLGSWMSIQRKAKDTMSPERRQRLEALDFVWDPFADQWEEGVRALERYRQREGHCRIPISHREQGYRLGVWVSTQREDKDTLPPERHQRLDALGFVWDQFADQWEEGVRALERYCQDQGNGLVPQSYRDPASGFRLGRWVRRQRTAKETMLPERRARLDALGFVWKVR
jgi:DNA-binding TFAR19-related protein (PDSD5 family)